MSYVYLQTEAFVMVLSIDNEHFLEEDKSINLPSSPVSFFLSSPGKEFKLLSSNPSTSYDVELWMNQ